MKNIFFIGDTHFGHSNILTFKDNEGQPLRPFNSIEEMDMKLIENWNSVVKVGDTVYHLGDVTFNKKKLWYLPHLNGIKNLVKGNHDTFKLSVYSQYFKNIYGVKPMYLENIKIVLSHVPLHPDCLDRWGTNVHGHLHRNEIKDDRYINVCVEKINYTPIHWDELKLRIKS